MHAEDSAPRRAGWRSWGTAHGAWIAAVTIVVVGAAFRMLIAVHNVETPMIDENEVVEQAVAFMGPNRHFYFIKYGPLTMYALAAIYRIAALVHGLSPLEYAARVFLEGSEHYAIARVYTLGWLSVLAAATFGVLRRQIGARPALLGCALLAFPLVEIVVTGARIDVPQGAFQCLALLALTRVVDRPRYGDWLAAGAFAGLAIATKPLPGLLIAPSFLLASWFAAAQRADGTLRTLPARLGSTFASPGLWLGALACATCAAAGDPAILDLRQFIQGQRDAVALHSGNALEARASISHSFLMLRIPFVACAILSAVLLAGYRDRRAFVIGLFVLVYIGAFAGRASRNYFMAAPAAALCILIAHGWARAETLLSRLSLGHWLRWGGLPLAVLLIARPTQIAWRGSQRNNPVLETSNWMRSNVPAGTRIFHLGGRPYGTYLVPTNERLQAYWGDHFQYGRDKYPFLKEAFHLGYQNYVKSGQPRYNIELRRDRVLPRNQHASPRWVTDGLLRRARQKRQKYIVIAGFRERDVRDLGYTWFNQAILEMQASGFAIFRVPEGPLATAPGPSP